MSGRQQGLNLPVNINMESLLRWVVISQISLSKSMFLFSFFSTINGAQSSPLLYFGKAALLGFTSKGNTGTCSYAYPECPSDPDKVVKYLNNHNGGFFRFFNEASTQNYQQFHHQMPYKRKAVVEQRIQNNVVDYNDNFKHQSSVVFPKEEKVSLGHSYETLKYPNFDFISNNKVNEEANYFPMYSNNPLKFPNEEHTNRKPKQLLHYNSEYDLDLQKPLPNHKASPMIFPDRTGTGDLRLDPEELQDYPRPTSYKDDDIRVVFNGFNNGGANFDAHHDKSERGFSFPP